MKLTSKVVKPVGKNEDLEAAFKDYEIPELGTVCKYMIFPRKTDLDKARMKNDEKKSMSGVDFGYVK